MQQNKEEFDGSELDSEIIRKIKKILKEENLSPFEIVNVLFASCLILMDEMEMSELEYEDSETILLIERTN